MSNEVNFDELLAFAQSAPLQAGGSYAKVDIAGEFKCKVLEASYGKNQAGTAMRGFVKVEVVESLGTTEDRSGARTNLYINVGAKPEHTKINLGPWVKTLLDLGVSYEKITDDATDVLDIIQNITTIITKQLKTGKEIVIWLRTKSDGKGGLYKNVEAFSKYSQTSVHTPAVEEAKTGLVVSADPF